ncbi:DUF1433 domain-containing protein [Listeria monocytogenes]|uniref:DUF1433 domain-containing protein n=1 Tax=Listeria monocytogenes TaxID=1639 RepID=UPI0008745104|nr:DUF1433 domain-containing protein [Listeria monocytogenes]EAC6409782.1 DUF1433 domain-containing protein [Listeria monocytogenes]EAD5257469.1 DUF1433 domain-containing protein [Listeria monocytogenes]EAD5327188.1 DUF1433 domain-containing protein [Listeria monocytogenes]EAF1658414.1 DUF1433 domain-containing protein [Listeria monocytogenes]EIE4865950.1 DUF1433 domain-containing protein [Listeria monocytogenes]
MKKHSIILISILILVLCLFCGFFFWKKYEIQNTNKILTQQKPRIKVFFDYNYNGINEITLTSLQENPTGVVHIKGYLNGDEDLWIDAGLFDSAGVEIVNSAKEVDEQFLKNENEENIKTVSEIQQEENSKKQ